jgi:DNA invertase Pin-like site-specific DNA recombinase
MTTTKTAGRTRVALYIRLSRESLESASVETQRAAALAWISRHYPSADVTEYPDSGVSGAKPLEERDEMRKLMRDRPHVIIAWKQDRYARNVSEFLRLVAWAEAHGATLATTDGQLNTATVNGRMVATVLAALAEWERDMIKARIIEGQATRRTQGRWVSGKAPYGFRIERKDGAAYLAHDDETIGNVRDAIETLLVDGTVTGTARMLGIGERQWRRMLTNGILRGHFSHNGKLVLAEDGITPLQFCEPLLNAAEAKKVRERLNALARGENAPRQGTPLVHSGVGTCYKCHGNLFAGKRRDGVPRYRCKIGCSSITMNHLDERVESEFLTRWGNTPEHTVRYEGGNDLSAELEEAKEKAQRIAASMSEAGPLMLATLTENAAQLEAAYASLRAAHDPDVRQVLEPTGRTIGEAWEASERPARGTMLADVGMHITLWPRTRPDRIEVTWSGGGDDQALADMLGDLDAQQGVNA